MALMNTMQDKDTVAGTQRFGAFAGSCEKRARESMARKAMPREHDTKQVHLKSDDIKRPSCVERQCRPKACDPRPGTPNSEACSLKLSQACPRTSTSP